MYLFWSPDNHSIGFFANNKLYRIGAWPSGTKVQGNDVTLQAGTKLGPYEITGAIGAGGMGLKSVGKYVS